jgi:hypothetical protein
MKLGKDIICSVVLIAALARPSHAQVPRDSALQFVQSFLTWYVQTVIPHHEGPAWYAALAQETWGLSPELRAALRADSAAKARASGVIVGLDFDPFLDTQDPWQRYEARSVSRKGPRYFISIYGFRDDNNMARLEVIAEVARRNGSWVFTNFHYPKEHTDLLRVLRRLRS